MDVKEIIDKIRQSIDTSTQKEHDNIIGSTISITLLNGSERTNIEFPAKFLFLSSFTREGEKIPGPVVLGYYDEELHIIAGEVDMTAIISQIPIEQMESCILKLHFENHDYYTSYNIYSLSAYGIDSGDLTPSTESIDIPLKKIYDEYGRWGFGIYPFDWGSYAEVNGATLDITLITLTSIAVTKKPNKITYTVGETFDKAGMVVTAYYSNGTSKTITDYTPLPSGKLTLNDTAIIIAYEGKTATLPIFVLGEININETDKRYLYFKDRQFIDANAGENLCRIDARSGILHFSRGLLSFGGKKLPLNLSLVYDYQHRTKTTIYGRETGFPQGFRTNYHQTCVPKGGKYFYTDGSAYLHIFEKAENTSTIYVDRQGTGLLLEEDKDGEIKIYDEYGNYSLFDGYGRLRLIHQKFTSSNSAELTIQYDGITEKITSITDGMGRETTFRYEIYNLWITANGSAKIWISMHADLTMGSVHRENNNESERDNYLTDNGKLYQITAANGERLKLEYKDDEVSKYFSNIQDSTYTFNYERENYKTTVTDNKGVEQVYRFNEEDILVKTYQLEDDEEVDVYFVDKEACTTFSSALATNPLRTFEFSVSPIKPTVKEITLSHKESIESGPQGVYWMSDSKFYMLYVKLSASGNARNQGGTVTADLISQNGSVLCPLQFNPSLEGEQIAAKPFTVNTYNLSHAQVKLKLNTDCTQGVFTFKDMVILPMLGTVEKLCTNMDIGEGGFSYQHNDNNYAYRVFFLNGGKGFEVNNKKFTYPLYSEDYLSNLRNVNKGDKDFIFWYNNKRGCYIGAKSATVSFDGYNSICFNVDRDSQAGSKVYIITDDKNEKLDFYSLSSGKSAVSTLNSPNYDSQTFPPEYQNYYLKVDTIITNGFDVRNSAYYDSDLNLRIEQKADAWKVIQQTNYELDDAGNVIAVKTETKSGESLNLLSEYEYDDKGYQISATDYVGAKAAKSHFTYDFFGNLLTGKTPNAFIQHYVYDSFGDRLTRLKAVIENEEACNDIAYENARFPKCRWIA